MRALAAATFVSLAFAATPTAQAAPQIAESTLEIEGNTIHYLTAGSGPPLILLHGFAQTSRVWRPIILRLAEHFRVIAPDLPGFGDSAIPKDGLDMKTAAVRIHALAHALNVQKAVVVGHDIGLMVAYAYAALHPDQVEKLVLMDAFLPGIGDWQHYYFNPKRWHFFFNGPTPEALVNGRERIYLDHFWSDFAFDGHHSVSEADRQAYTAAYARPGRMRAAWAYFAALPDTAKQFGALAANRLPMPVLVITGETAAGTQLSQQVRLAASDVTAVVLPKTGHWLLDENPKETTAALERFLGTATK